MTPLLRLLIAPLTVVGLTLSAATVLADHLGEVIQSRIDFAATTPEVRDRAEAGLYDFYVGRAFRPLWIDHDGLNDRGRQLYEAMVRSDRHGLEPQAYGVEEIGALSGKTSEEALGDLEILMSSAFLRYAQDVRNGRIKPSRLDSDLYIEPKLIDPREMLNGAIAATDFAAFLASLPPRSDQYVRTVEALARYRAIAAAGGWPLLPEGETLKVGMNDPRVPLIRQRLIADGDLADTVPADITAYDAALEEAVKHFQYRHGLEQDGAVGKNTRAAFNVPVEERIRTMIINLERRRWLPDDLGRRYVFVNMAGFELKLVVDDDTVFDTRIIVGTPYHSTPVFSGQMTYMVLNPYWHITPSIARNEILPAVKKNVNYLAEKNIRVFSDWSSDAVEINPYSIDWSRVTASTLRYKFRQDSGPGNALGRVKFMFPNEHSVYLHDTPTRHLFDRAQRSFSHGCIRVQHPLDLAELLLREMPGWTRERIDSVVQSNQRMIVNLDQPIPVYLTYLTNWVNKDGSVYFSEDIYGRDKKLLEALDHKPS